MELVCFQGLDKNNWAQVNSLISKGDWNNIVLIKNKSADNLQTPANCKTITVNSDSNLLDLKEEMTSKLKASIGKEFEVALSIASGTGKENMALISALLSIPVGIRLVAFTKKGIEFIN